MLAALDDQLFAPAIVETAMAQVRAAFAQGASAHRPEALTRELTRIEAQLDRLADAVQLSGGEIATLLERMRRLEERRGALWAERDRLRCARSTRASSRSWKRTSSPVSRSGGKCAGSSPTQRDDSSTTCS